MDDKTIIALYETRSQDAIRESENKYGRYCYTVAFRILQSHEDAEEAVNDTWHRVWGLIPPEKPRNLSSFLAKITRNLSLDLLEKRNAQKRANALSLIDELAEAIPDGCEDLADSVILKEAINTFLASLSREARTVFIQRYWYSCSVKEIMRLNHMSESAVKTSLFRSREAFRRHLETYAITP